MTNDETAKMMELLYIQRAPALPASALAEVFDRLIWCLADHGAALLRVREQWLKAKDKERVEIALAMDETYPFDEKAEMEAVLTRISTRWPDLRPRCAELLAARSEEET